MRQEIKAIETEVRIARIVTGMVLGILVGGFMLVTNAIAAKPAGAQEAAILWAERALVVEALEKKYTEIPRALGVTSDGSIIELFSAPDGDTWTLVITLPNGLSRVMASGESWITRPLPPQGHLS
ncbi:MAG: hypothetical protein HOM58_04685 [Rhodospirillaceae bacterium]|jgi:hypothetical protein|nr:hypothetical protein [Rhodospirillaceae bacterium]MBT5459719.1 hypothetical protein [Rhodospirillaceae bacterium]